MAAPIPRIAGPVHLLARAVRWLRVAMLRSSYQQKAELAAQIAHQQQEDAMELMALRRQLTGIGHQLRDLGELPPHLPDHIDQGSTRCEP